MSNQMTGIDKSDDTRCGVHRTELAVSTDRACSVGVDPTPEALVVSSPKSRRLRARARQLRRDATVRLAPLADALRRRAAELELQAFVLDNALIPIPVNAR